jgi:hypothetical protein
MIGLQQRVQIIFLRRIIKCKQIVPQPIVLAEFGAQPFRLETVFDLISLLHRIRRFVDTAKGRDRYPYLAYRSSESIASASSLVHSRCRYVGVLDLLASTSITMDHLPPFRYSLDTPGHFLPAKQEMNTIIGEGYLQADCTGHLDKPSKWVTFEDDLLC